MCIDNVIVTNKSGLLFEKITYDIYTYILEPIK
jgi:hypothetical protein